MLVSLGVQKAKEQFDQGNNEMALEILGHILENPPQSKAALELQNKINESEEKDKKDIAHAELNKGRDEEEKNNFLDSKKCYENALKADPENKEASEGLKRASGLVDPVKQKERELEKNIQTKRKAKAEVCLEEIKTMSPDYPRLKYWEKRIAELKNDNEQSYDSQAEADETYNLGLESYRNGDLANAVKFWKETLNFNPNHEQAKRNLDRLLQEHPELK